MKRGKSGKRKAESGTLTFGREQQLWLSTAFQQPSPQISQIAQMGTRRRRRRKADARSLFALCVPTAADVARWQDK
jgi:hypothetical protein